MDPRLAARRRTVAETRVRKGLRRLLVVLVVVGLAAVALAVLRSSLFSVDRIVASGQVVTDPVSVLDAAGITRGMPLIEVDLEEAEAALLTDPYVATAEVGRRWPDALAVTVVERTPVAWVDRGGGWEHLALDGVVLAAGEPGALAPRIRSVAGEERALEAALVFVDALAPRLKAGMVIDARVDDLVGTWNGLILRLGRPTDMEAKARALEVVVDDEPEAGSEITLIAPDRPAVLPPTTTTLPDEEDGGG